MVLVQMLVTFDMTGVKKQDMHVSYRTNRLIVSWRVERTVERQDGDVVVREREVRRYSHTIPLPDGTKVCFLKSRPWLVDLWHPLGWI